VSFHTEVIVVSGNVQEGNFPWGECSGGKCLVGNVWKEKYPGEFPAGKMSGGMSGRENIQGEYWQGVISRGFPRGNVPGVCPGGKISGGNIGRGDVHSGNVRAGNVLRLLDVFPGQLPGNHYLILGTCYYYKFEFRSALWKYCCLRRPSAGAVISMSGWLHAWLRVFPCAS